MEKCIICSEILSEYYIDGLLKCNNCGFVTTNIDIPNDELEIIYSKSYFMGDEYADYLRDRKIIQRNFLNRVNKIIPYVNFTKKINLFEIGCAYGLFLDLVRNRFNNVSGIDISKDAINYARKELMLDVIPIDYLNYKISKKVDVICMWDTIEHLNYPHLYIEKAYQHLCENGIIAITTGDIDSLNARFRGEKWRQIHPPTHLHYFSRATLINLLEKNNFEICEYSYPANLMSLKSIAYILLVIKKKNYRLFNILDKIGIFKINIYVNMFDLIFIIARKKN